MINNIPQSQEENQDTIQRSPHDKENPFVMIRKEAIQDKHLTIEARGTLAFLLSFPNNWKISIKHLMNSLNIGKQKAYSIIDNLVDRGYLCKKGVFEGNLKRGERYFLSETRKFDNPIVRELESSTTLPYTKYCISTKEELSKEEYLVFDYFLEKYNGYRNSLKEKPFEEKDIKRSWITDTKSLVKNHTKEKLFGIIDFTFSDPFWRKTVKCPGGLRRNFTMLEDRLAEGKCSSDQLKTIIEQNLTWLGNYCAWRERVGAMGILHYNSEKAWDEHKGFEWKMSSPKLKEQIENFYKNYR